MREVLTRSSVGSVSILASVVCAISLGLMFSETFDITHCDSASQSWCEPDINLLQERLHLSATLAIDLYNQRTTAPHDVLVAAAEIGVDRDAALKKQAQTVFASRVVLPLAMQHDTKAKVALAEGRRQVAEHVAASQTTLPSPRSEEMHSPSDGAARDPDSTMARQYEMHFGDQETRNKKIVAMIQGTYRALSSHIAGAAQILSGSLRKSVGSEVWIMEVVLCLLGFVILVGAAITLMNRESVDENSRDVKRQQNDGLLTRGGDLRSTPFGDRGVGYSVRPRLSNVSSGPPSSWDSNVAPMPSPISLGSGRAGVQPGLTSDSQLPMTAANLAAAASAQEKANSGAPMDFSQQSVNVPPPLCPALVLPVCEARFAVPMTALLNVDPKGFDVVGLSGNPLLRAVLRSETSGPSTLEIILAHAHSSPRATVGPPRQASAGNGWEICGPNNTFYGMLVHQSNGGFVVSHGNPGRQVMVIEGDIRAKRLTVSSGDCRALASVSCGSSNFDVEHMELRVHPGVDAVLVLSCVLAVVLLTPGSVEQRVMSKPALTGL